MLALTALVLWRLESQISSVDWVEHSDQVILRTKDAEIQMQRINLAVIAYLHSPDRRFVDEIINGRHAFARDLARIAALVADNPEQEKAYPAKQQPLS